MRAKAGDKVRLKLEPYRGVRGIVERRESGDLVVRVDSTGEVVRVRPSSVTNYSLAARRAWKRMPERRVGRPKGSGLTGRVSVTFRIDRGLWERFRLAEGQGLIADRTEAINAWIGEKLGEIVAG